nr:unnamed protein product [Spirometra erinaceieuropaei]
MCRRAEVLRLYKDLLKYAQGVQYSDRAYLSNLFKTEFRKHAKETDAVFIEFLYTKGQSVLRNRRFI